MSLTRLYITQKPLGTKSDNSFPVINDPLVMNSWLTRFKAVPMASQNVIPADQKDLLNSTAMSLFGRPVFSDVQLTAGNYDIILIRVLLSVELVNTIVKTPLQGRPGTIKEYVTAEDYAVMMSGSIQTNDPDKYPVNDVRDMIRLLKEQDTIDVVSEYLSLFDIHKLVVDRALFRQEEGTQNVQKFEINFLSDEDIQLVMKEEQNA
jgi:hypothetical protein